MPHPFRAPGAFVFSFAIGCIALLAQGNEKLTYADVGKPMSWQGTVPTAHWAADGVHVEYQENGVRLWLDATTGTSEPAPKVAAAAGVEASAPMAVLLHKGELWLDRQPPPQQPQAGGRRRRPSEPSERAVQLTSDGDTNGNKQEARLSPDGASVAFVRGNNLCVLDVATKQTWQVTNDGGPELFHGALDWVYQEEVYGRGDYCGHWWSQAAGLLAFLSLDESAVREFTIVDHVPDGFLDRERVVHTEVTNYPKAGDPNPAARLTIVRVADHTLVPVDLSALPPDVLVVRVEWTPDGKTLLATVQDRIQSWAELCAVDPETGKVTRWIHEQSKTWVNRPKAPRWLADGSFLWLSERTGYAHVYHYAAGGKLLAAVTAGEWQVRGIERVDEKVGQLWFEGTKDGATGRHLYRIGLDGQGLVCLTPGIGTHGAELDAAGTFLIDRWSSMEQPTSVCVRHGDTGAVVKELGQAGKGDNAAKYAFADRKRVTITARDGYELDGSVQLPPDWQPNGKYPVYLPTYSGPDAPTVRDSWSHSTYSQFLAQQGFVILQVNVRSASGRGQVHAGTCYRQLGVQELKDLEDAVDHVVAHFGGDAARVAISGWSYGGFMTAYALTHSTKFALGLAGAGVHDWRLYDTIYTERYMRTPQENAAGYDATSVIKAAKNLHGHLVLLHGSMDDNVHLQNTMQLLWELESADMQDFELMIYPRSRHGLEPRLRPHSEEFQWRRLQRLLEPAAAPR